MQYTVGLLCPTNKMLATPSNETIGPNNFISVVILIRTLLVRLVSAPCKDVTTRK